MHQKTKLYTHSFRRSHWECSSSRDSCLCNVTYAREQTPRCEAVNCCSSLNCSYNKAVRTLEYAVNFRNCKHNTAIAFNDTRFSQNFSMALQP